VLGFLMETHFWVNCGKMEGSIHKLKHAVHDELGVRNTRRKLRLNINEQKAKYMIAAGHAFTIHDRRGTRILPFETVTL
jgi:hypothetical protein